MCHAKITGQVLFRVVAFHLADHGHWNLLKLADPPHNGRVITEIPISGERQEIGE